MVVAAPSHWVQRHMCDRGHCDRSMTEQAERQALMWLQVASWPQSCLDCGPGIVLETSLWHRDLTDGRCLPAAAPPPCCEPLQAANL